MTDDQSKVANPAESAPDRARVSGATPEPSPDFSREAGADVELAIVTMRFDARDVAAMHDVLSKYVVLTRMVPGCRNVDLCSSVTVAGRLLVIQKWDDLVAQRAHFDSALMVEMAESCHGLLASAPEIDLWDGLSAHDLR